MDKYDSTSGVTFAWSMNRVAVSSPTNRYEWNTGLNGMSSPRRLSNQAVNVHQYALAIL